MKKISITMIMPVRTQPRYQKRIKGLLGEGFAVSSLFFERKYFEGNELPCISENIGMLSHGGYISRVFHLFCAAIKIRDKVKNSQVIYCFGLDMLLLVFLSGRSNKIVVYEVSDIRPIVLKKGLVGALARMLEKFLLKEANILVATAPGYISGYYKNILQTEKLPNFLIIENKLTIYALPERPLLFYPQESKKIVIGYFGLLRCQRSWSVLKRLVDKFPEKFEISIYGLPIDPVDLPQQAKHQKGIIYNGQYIWPDDLNKMYGSVDLVWACYPFGESAPGNWQWAMTNRFYEACYFKKPLIVLKNSADAVRVQDCEIGAVIDLENVNDAVEWIAENITIEILKYFSSNIDKLPRNVFMYTDEHTKLAQLIRE